MTRVSRQQLRKAEYYAVAVGALFVAAVALAGLAVGPGDVLDRLASLSPVLVAGLLALSLVNYGFRTLRWQLFGRRLGMAVSVGRTTLIYVAGFAMTPTPGKFGEALRLWLMERAYGFRYARTAALMIGDRIGDATAVMALCLLGVSAYAGHALATALAGAGIIAFALVLARPRPLLQLIGAGYRLFGRWPRLFAGARHAVRQTARLFDPTVMSMALVLGGIGWLAECVGLYWLVNAMGAPLSLQGAVFVFAFSLLVGAISMLPGGVGGTEATMFALLVLADIPADTALAATAVNRAVTLWFAVLLGVAVLPAALRLAGGPAAAGEADSRA